MSTRDDYAKGRSWFKQLSRHDKFDLGDQFVLGTFDWRDWFEAPKPAAFLNGAEYERLLWEQGGAG